MWIILHHHRHQHLDLATFVRRDGHAAVCCNHKAIPDWDPNSWAFQGQFHLSFSELAMCGLQISVIWGLSLHDSTFSLSALAVSQHWIRGKSGKKPASSLTHIAVPIDPNISIHASFEVYNDVILSYIISYIYTCYITFNMSCVNDHQFHPTFHPTMSCPGHWSPTNSDHVHQLLGGEAAAHAIHQTKAVIPGGFSLQWHKENEKKQLVVIDRYC